MLFVSQLPLVWQYLGRESMLIDVHPRKFRKNVISLALFGPAARDEATVGSEIELLEEFNRAIGR